ncbi:MAG TPA: MBL fold metallo-hydrolase, partial [Pyrinomonadaceae bacterium]|nr:MBL fold metallo-hydrolase [Pyrinomonadaceae bacterium]
MSRATRGCGCLLAVLVILFGAAGYLGYRFVLPWWKAKPPAPSGGELQVHVLDVGPVEGDSILLISPAGKSVLIDAGEAGKGKVVLEALKRNNVQQLDYFIATHPHPDHLGGADEVFKAIKVINVLDNGLQPVGFSKPVAPAKSGKAPAKKGPAKPDAKSAVTRFYEEYMAAIEQSGAHYEKVEPGKTLDLGGGARLTVLAPSEPVFTRDQMKAGGNEPNANSVVVRLDYGGFSMLLPGDAEAQTEHRLLSKDLYVR